jgi:predicted nuclease of predicted toxin-antitoxin system
MRFLANENFPLASVRRLREAGHDVTAIIESEPGSKDPSVLARAVREARIILTFDRDYGELIYRRRMPPPPGVVFCRFVPRFPEEAAEIVLAVQETPGLRLEGRYTVIDSQRVRQRPLP